MLLQLDDADPESEDHTIEDLSHSPIDESHEDSDHHLSLNSINGFSSVGTLWFTGCVNGLEVQVLVDGGRTDNFFQPRLAKFLKLPIEPIPYFNVLVGNGHKMVAEGKITDMTVTIQGILLL